MIEHAGIGFSSLPLTLLYHMGETRRQHSLNTQSNYCSHYWSREALDITCGPIDLFFMRSNLVLLNYVVL